MASLHPNIRADNSPLRALMYNVVARFGDFDPADIQGELAELAIQWGNSVVSDWNMHPYNEDNTPVGDYISVDDAREVPDLVMSEGLYFKYCEQQASEKMAPAQASYFRALNHEAYRGSTGGVSKKLSHKVRT